MDVKQYGRGVGLSVTVPTGEGRGKEGRNFVGCFLHGRNFVGYFFYTDGVIRVRGVR